MAVSLLLESMGSWLAQCDGVTISGGEPFEQPQALTELLTGIRSRANCNVLVYSGKVFEQLEQHPLIGSGLIDALISDPFELDTPQTKALRGSDNQRLHLLTPRGAEAFGSFERPTNQGDRRLDVMFDADGVVWLAGIPRRGDMKRLQQMLALQGSAITTTEARS
jgi:anaerobic ribonucleoside-triphosphate reductase activating protein